MVQPNLFNDTTTYTNFGDDAYPTEWEAPWDTKAAILLIQGVAVTLIVTFILCVCGRKHIRRMNNLMRVQELATIRIPEVSSGGGMTAAINNGEDGNNSRLRQSRRIFTAPLRFIDDVVNTWASAPSTDFEYYDRMLVQMQRERENRRESVEERTKRLMNAFNVGECVWEIEEKHFIRPCSDKSVEREVDSKDLCSRSPSTDIEIGLQTKICPPSVAADIESGLQAQIDNIYSQFHEKMMAIAVGSSRTGLIVDVPSEEEDVQSSDKEYHSDQATDDREDESENNHMECETQDDCTTPHRNNRSPLMGSPNSSKKLKETDDNASSRKLTRSASFTSFDSTPSYLYLNISQNNRIRANSTGSSPNIVQNTMSTSSSEPSFSSPAASCNNYRQRAIPNQCAICLCDYTKGDNVVLSSNTSCLHAFHQECIIEWLVKMQEGTPCPCCRRPFVELESVEVDERLVGDREREMTEEELGALRRHLQLGFQRGRAFNASVIRF